MKIISIFLLLGIPIFSFAKNYGCATAGLSMESSLFDSLSKNLNIDTSNLDETKAMVEILDVSPISKFYAEHLARIDYNNDADPNKTENTYNKIYLSSYYNDDVKIITAKYTYTNEYGKKDVFIASSLMNKHECSVRFNGYLTLSREF